MSEAKENGFGQNLTVAGPELGIGLKESLHQLIGRAVKLQNHSKGAREFIGNKPSDADLTGNKFCAAVQALFS